MILDIRTYDIGDLIMCCNSSMHLFEGPRSGAIPALSLFLIFSYDVIR